MIFYILQNIEHLIYNPGEATINILPFMMHNKCTSKRINEEVHRFFAIIEEYCLLRRSLSDED